MRYYEVHLNCGDSRKHQERERTIYVQIPETDAPMSNVLEIIKKISFGRLIIARAINREEYIAGVSGGGQ